MDFLGIDGFAVTAEINVANGAPIFEVVGLPDASVKESRERVRAAMKNSGFKFPGQRITVNLAPADKKKEGPSFDLAIALGMLVCTGVIPAEKLKDVVVLGELSLNGSVRSVRGALPMTIFARTKGAKVIVIPADNLAEVRCIDGIEIIGVHSLIEAVRHFDGTEKILPLETVAYDQLLTHRSFPVDFSNVKGQMSWGQVHRHYAFRLFP